VKEPNKFHIYETEKITCKTSDAVEYIELFGFYHPRSSCTMHLMLLSERPLIYASLCMTISGERTEQLDIFCCVTGFTSDFHTPQMSADICIGMTISGERTKQHVVIGFGEVLAVD